MSKTQPDKPNLGARKLLGRNLRRLRQERDLGLDDLSGMTGIAATRLDAIEDGRADIRLDAIDRLAAALDVPVRRLFVEGDR